MRGKFTLLNPHNYNTETHLQSWIQKALKYYRRVVQFSPSDIQLELTDAESLVIKIQHPKFIQDIPDFTQIIKTTINEYFTEADFWTPEMLWAYRWVFSPF